jgi:hypothetical protein
VPSSAPQRFRQLLGDGTVELATNLDLQTSGSQFEDGTLPELIHPPVELVTRQPPHFPQMQDLPK